MIVPGAVEILSVGRIKFGVVLRALDVPIVNPTEFTINVSFLSKLGVVRHPCSFDFILIIGVQLSLRLVHDALLVSEVFIEVVL